MRLRKKCLGTIAYLGGLPAVLEPFTWSWGQMLAFNGEHWVTPGHYIHYDRATVSLHDYARNTLVGRFQGDWLLQLDTDLTFDPDLAHRLVTAAETYDLPVVTGIYRHKYGPYQPPVIYQWNEAGNGLTPIADWSADVSLLRIGSAGGGALLIRRDVFERITDELHEEPFARFNNFGEDHAFFARCKKLDIPVYAALKVEAEHLIIKGLPLSEYTPPPTSMQGPRCDTEGFI